MPNWCHNTCSVDGTEKELHAFFDALEQLVKQETETNNGQVFPGIEYPKGKYIWMHYINCQRDDEYFNFCSAWNTLREPMRLASEHFNIELEIEFEESSMGLYGKSKFKNGKEIYYVELDQDELDLEFNEELDCWIDPNGLKLESEIEYYENKIEDKITKLPE